MDRVAIYAQQRRLDDAWLAISPDSPVSPDSSAVENDVRWLAGKPLEYPEYPKRRAPRRYVISKFCVCGCGKRAPGPWAKWAWGCKPKQQRTIDELSRAAFVEDWLAARAEQQVVAAMRVKVGQHARRALLTGVDATLTPAEWSAILAYHNASCVWCGTYRGPFHMDHVVPLAKGGPHSADNVAPACAPCNTAKRDINPADFYERQERQKAA